jgi:DNA mismatch repair protein MutL
MKNIAVLDQNTIDKIAAGEVIERPSSIVKELVENAIDAGANAITVEIKEGGISLIRITDNGEGIEASQVPLAFLRHATSKISKVEDLLNVASLGFRGEALSSIAAVCQVELITKTAGSLTGVRYLIEGGKEKGLEEIGAPEGTTFLVRNIFYNTPARKKFLKTPMTEAGYISNLMERMAMSHPEIAFKFINNNQTKLHTSGNANLKDVIYGLYGRDIASNLVEIHTQAGDVAIDGFIGKPVISRGNRNYENYFINGRYIRSSIIAKAIEDGYKTFMMQHKYPFTALHFSIDGRLLDINVHPTKMELRFADNQGMYQLVQDTVKQGLSHRELIPVVSVKEEKKTEVPQMKRPVSVPEPFEKKRREQFGEERAAYKTEWNSGQAIPVPKSLEEFIKKGKTDEAAAGTPGEPEQVMKPYLTEKKPGTLARVSAQQLNLFEDKLLSKEHIREHRLIGQLFDTYWLVEFHEKLYIIDQHAAHEKVLYERTMKSLENKEFTSQQLSPPMILTLNMQEEALLSQYMEHFTRLGFEIEPFGGKEYSVSAVPANLYGIAQKELFLEMLDGLAEQTGRVQAEMINKKIASMSCKAAVKGNHRISALEAEALIGELLSLENPYNCPHGRPTIISMTKYELEKKFKRIV